MILEGDYSVIEAIKEKKRLMDAGEEHGHIRPMLFVDGGLMKAAYGIGGGLALEELGYHKAFTSMVGVSSGAVSVAYFASENTKVGGTIAWEECSSRKFINMWRFWNQVNTFYVAGALRGVTGKGVDTEKVFASPAEVYIGVANFETGEPKLIKPKTGEELLMAIQASILMPNVSTDVVKFNDIRYVDGGFTSPHVLSLALEEVDATHVLIMTNQDKTVITIPLLERFFNHTIFRWRMPKALRFAAHERKKERMRAIAEMKDKGEVSYALVWGDHSIRSMERDSKVVKSVVEKSKAWWLTLLARE